MIQAPHTLREQDLIKTCWTLPSSVHENLDVYFLRVWNGNYLRDQIYQTMDERSTPTDDHDYLYYQERLYRTHWHVHYVKAWAAPQVVLSFRGSEQHGYHVLVRIKGAY